MMLKGSHVMTLMKTLKFAACAKKVSAELFSNNFSEITI
jgi:hypothetical protein